MLLVEAQQHILDETSGHGGVDEVSVLAGHPVIQDSGGHVALVDLATQIHFGSDSIGLSVVLTGNLLDENVVGIPVVLVLDPDELFLRHPAGADVAAAVQDLVAVSTELVGDGVAFGAVVIDDGLGILDDQGLIESLVDGQVAAVGQQSQEVSAGLTQMIDQSVIIQSLDTQSGEVGLSGLIGPVVQLDAVDDVGNQHVGHVGVKLGVSNQTGSGNEVVSSQIGILFAFAGVPLNAFTDLEGPGQTVVGNIPALCQAGNDVAVAVELDQGIHEVGQRLLVVGNRSGQVVHGGDLRSVQVVISGVFSISDTGQGISGGFGSGSGSGAVAGGGSGSGGAGAGVVGSGGAGAGVVGSGGVSLFGVLLILFIKILSFRQ